MAAKKVKKVTKKSKPVLSVVPPEETAAAAPSTAEIDAATGEQEGSHWMPSVFMKGGHQFVVNSTIEEALDMWINMLRRKEIIQWAYYPSEEALLSDNTKPIYVYAESIEAIG